MNQSFKPTIQTVFIPIRPTQKGLIGFANLTYGNELALNGVAVYTKPNGDGFRLVYPLNKNIPNETFYFCPLNRAFGDLLTKAVSEKVLLTRGEMPL
jgi:hypothetical protein